VTLAAVVALVTWLLAAAERLFSGRKR